MFPFIPCLMKFGIPEDSTTSQGRFLSKSQLRRGGEAPGALVLGPSGKRLHNYGKSPCLMGKFTISMAIFNSYFDVTRG